MNGNSGSSLKENIKRNKCIYFENVGIFLVRTGSTRGLKDELNHIYIALLYYKDSVQKSSFNNNLVYPPRNLKVYNN